ncbi:YdcF family protein [Umezawaea endophytica]|uniref:YdcF family protein n=1 Tax=Umezawaea endophytica TaxID=1654476 RepID=A0A9X2VVT2_9PSEU|nr:YdcF family protein [Umezawaea endophytica]MCS7483112.1 YdcF family protein [Umezawaea endophytica]
MAPIEIPAQHRADVLTLWDYHNMKHEVRPVDAAIGLGSHDIGVAVRVVELYKAGAFPLVVFTGANAPTTIERFPRGEAVHYREYALAHDVPDEAIMIETEATNTAENFDFTRKVLQDKGIEFRSAVLVSRPYQERRAYATCRKMWPELDIICTSHRPPIDEYVAEIGDADFVISMMVGDTQRMTLFAKYGYAIPQDVPQGVQTAYERLITAGYTSRLI